MENQQTIFAVATARGRAGVAVIRISGPGAIFAVEQLAKTRPVPRKSTLRTLWRDGEPLDQALIITFERGASFTGEEVAELHIHGGLAVVESVLSALEQLPGLRPASAGEFTRRALENNRLDLAQVEGLADLINAETEVQRKQALKVMQGALSEKCEAWRGNLLRAMALLEAVIDFADEDIPLDVYPEVHALLLEVLDNLNSEIKGFSGAERVRDGFEVAIIGRPNIGKSTLLNAIAGREVALTSEIAGTTRDVIEVRLDLEGIAVTLLDLAGIRATTDKIELLGVDRALERGKAADIRVFLVENLDDAESFGLDIVEDDIVIIGKGDLSGQQDSRVSGKTGLGVGSLLDRISVIVGKRVAGSSLLIRKRHLDAIELAKGYLETTISGLNNQDFFSELVVADLRCAIESLDILVGRIDIEQVLGEIFSDFCIGK